MDSLDLQVKRVDVTSDIQLTVTCYTFDCTSHAVDVTCVHAIDVTSDLIDLQVMQLMLQVNG
jgi:hypothetical protein